MSAWTALPALVSVLASAAALLTESSPMQIDPMQLQVLSLNELFFRIPMGQPGSALLNTLTLIAPWSWALTIICIRVWTQRSWAYSATFALLPSVIFYGGWALIAFR